MRSNTVFPITLIVILFSLPLIGRTQKIVAKYDDNAGTVKITREPRGEPKEAVDTFTVIYRVNQEEKQFSLDVGHTDDSTLNKTYLKDQNTEFSFDPDGKVIFKKGSSLDVYFCKDKKCFIAGTCVDAVVKKPDTSKKGGAGVVPSGFPFPPQFSPRSDVLSSLLPLDSLAYYHLVIDASPDIAGRRNNTLYEKKMRKGDSPVFKITTWLRVNSSVSIYISNYNFSSLEDINLSVNGKDYHYEQGIGNIYNSVLPEAEEKKVDKDNVSSQVALTAADSSEVIKNQLDWTLDYLNQFTSLNINDIGLLNQYKTNLNEFFAAHPGLFNEAAIALLNQILTWNPPMVSLSPVAVTIPDSDEVEFELKIKDKGVAEKKYALGSYYVKGKASVIAVAKGSLFFTTLKNNEAYIDSADHKAKLDDKHQMSVGIGASGILSFRTGSAWTPTINLGFFVPLGEDISPFGHLGPGINYGTQKVSFNLSAGRSFGKVNAIKARYKDIDMRTIQNIDVNGITEKVWKWGWSFSLGLSFNIAK